MTIRERDREARFRSRTIPLARDPGWKRIDGALRTRYALEYEAARVDEHRQFMRPRRPDDPFARIKNVTVADGVAPWTKDISHGERICDGDDPTLTIDPPHLQLLYRGRAPTDEKIDYKKLPCRLGLLTLATPGTQPAAARRPRGE